MHNTILLISVCLLFCTFSCSNNKELDNLEVSQIKNKQDFKKAIQKHLDAVVSKDLLSLKSTLSPKGKMKLIMQGSEIINSVSGFVDFHEEWFQDSLWTMESKVIHTEIGKSMGLAIVESLYKEPERNGKPYFNRMQVSYVLEKDEGEWYVINDHASSIERSPDAK